MRLWTGLQQETMSAWRSLAWTSSRSSNQKINAIHLIFSTEVCVYVLNCVCLAIFFLTDNMLPYSVGCVFCDPKEPIRVCTRFRARILLFNIEVPITQGFPVSATKHNHSLTINIQNCFHSVHILVPMCVSLCVCVCVCVLACLIVGIAALPNSQWAGHH